MTSLLISEPPLQVLPSLAVKLGSVDKAIILQQIHYWLLRSKNIEDGHKWVWNTVKDWHDQFPWLAERTVQRYLKQLVDDGYLIAGNYNKKKFDRTKWYRIAYDKLADPYVSTVHTKGTDSTYPYVLSGTTYTREYTETTSENTNTPLPPKGGERAEPVELPFGDPEPAPNPPKATDELKESFESLWRDYPRKAGKKQAFAHYKKWRKENKEHTAAYLAKRLGLYKAYLAANHTDPRYILQGSTWFNGRFEDDYAIRSPEPKDMYDRHYE